MDENSHESVYTSKYVRYTYNIQYINICMYVYIGKSAEMPTRSNCFRNGEQLNSSTRSVRNSYRLGRKRHTQLLTHFSKYSSSPLYGYLIPFRCSVFGSARVGSINSVSAFSRYWWIFFTHFSCYTDKSGKVLNASKLPLRILNNIRKRIVSQLN